MNLKKELGSVAEAVKKVMEAELSAKQKAIAKMSEPKHKIDVSAKQKAIAKMSEPKHKIDAGDLAKLRAGHKPVKEESEQLDELKKSTLGSYVKKASQDAVNKANAASAEAEYGTMKKSDEYEKKSEKRLAGVNKAATKLAKEEIESVEEGFDELMKAAKERQGPQPSGGAGVKKGTRYGGGRQKDEPESDKKKKFSEMVNLYSESGLKTFMQHTTRVNEEPDNEQFTKEFKDQLASMEGKKKQPSVAAPSTKGVKAMPEEVEQLDEIGDTPEGKAKLRSYSDKADAQVRQHWAKVHDKSYLPPDTKMVKRNVGVGRAGRRIHGFGIDKEAENKVTGRFDYRKAVGKTHVFNKEEVEQIEEREMTEPEMKKREKIVKSMKKGMAGFKERYGARAKNVMYATATKQAMKEENE